ncbi:transcription activator of gluconeogenesis [Acrodontium crateriforme]|uniref:riboflavin kinase n=1 Tax=Acrodontium crateriforme TaxID=150365 RepID=A0AAQ3M4C3_9PEZI|nr:transcription activator of gluconeogenesis [Acrodontium crateriforme]
MSSFAEDPSPSPEPATELESGNMAEKKLERGSSEEISPDQNANGNKAKTNAKDPSRPRRKKARRACFACQRAHLTCGDERPCLRCIKRGLQAQCHDGVRKKAKYLHDAPPEALMPGFSGNYQVNDQQNAPNTSGAPQPIPSGMAVSQPPAFFPPNQPGNFNQYGPSAQQGQMGAPVVDNNTLVNDFAATQNIETPQYQPAGNQQVPSEQDLPTNLDSSNGLGNPASSSFDSSFFESNDPSMFNFNLSDLNFGNHYGALEFGMLGHLSSGAVGTPDVDIMNSVNPASTSYDSNNAMLSNYNFNTNLPSWQSVPNAGSRHSSATNTWATQLNGTEAFAIGEQSSLTGHSPHSQDYNSYSMSPEAQFNQEPNNQSEFLRQSLSQAQQQKPKPSAFPGGPNQEISKSRRRPTSEIYSSVQAPYSYTKGFHALTAFLQKRFPSKKVLRIAKALATIRPSFIACNKSLNRDDLIFMEKCFQRTLCEYEGFVTSYATPTIICRRTGEIAGVSKEFSLITGWRRDVLLGKEPNLNVNTGSNGALSGTQTGSSTRGAATPRMEIVDTDPGRPQPVFLAELLDEDSVVKFYEDFADVAFGASRSSIIGVPCSLLKYRTKDDPGWGPNDHLTDDGKRIKRQPENKTDPLIRGEAGMNALGEGDGRVKCSLCWTVKRDVFDIPMLIVMNLGIPTANIPLAGNSVGGHDDVESGIYYGWAGLTHSKATKDHPPGSSSNYHLMTPSVNETLTKISAQDEISENGAVYPMVMSIGWNPFYKNEVRSAEVHVMHNFDTDFYGSHMNIEILGYIRPELDYVSKEKLIEDIKTDIDVAGRSLSREAYATRRKNPDLLDFENKGDVAT